MKKITTLLVSCLVFALSGSAQLFVKPADNATPTETGTAGAKIVQLVNAIRPASFQPSFKKEKTAFLSAAAASNDAPSMARNLSRLAGFIKPEKFKPGISRETIVKKAAAISTLAQAKALLIDMEADLQPKALADIWQLERGTWMSDLKSGNAK